MGWVTWSLSKSQHNFWLCSCRPWPAASYCRLGNDILTKISLSAFFRSFWVLFNSSFVFSNSETVLCSCRINPPRTAECWLQHIDKGDCRSPVRTVCSAAHATFRCLRAQFSCGSLTNLSCIRATERLPISSSCLQRDLQGCLPNTNLPIAFPKHLCLMVTAFPRSNTWWLHSEFLQDFGHTRAQELQTTGWRMVMHQQCWHMDKPDSTGKHARTRGREVD